MACLYPDYIFIRELHDITRAGLPHSGISGSQPVSGSPKLFVAYYALLRLQVPRHPPCALYNLTTQSFYTHQRFHVNEKLLFSAKFVFVFSNFSMQFSRCSVQRHALLSQGFCQWLMGIFDLRKLQSTSANLHFFKGTSRFVRRLTER